MAEIIVIDPDQLKSQIQDAVKEAMKGELPVSSKSHQEKSYLTRQETAELLKVSALTIDQWVKKGILPAYRIGNRVLFKSEDIESALSAVPTLKYSRK